MISPGAEPKAITAGEVHVALGFLHRLRAGLIQKPFNLQDLSRAMRRVLG